MVKIVCLIRSNFRVQRSLRKRKTAGTRNDHSCVALLFMLFTPHARALQTYVRAATSCIDGLHPGSTTSRSLPEHRTAKKLAHNRYPPRSSASLSRAVRTRGPSYPVKRLTPPHSVGKKVTLSYTQVVFRFKYIRFIPPICSVITSPSLPHVGKNVPLDIFSHDGNTDDYITRAENQELNCRTRNVQSDTIAGMETLSILTKQYCTSDPLVITAARAAATTHCLSMHFFLYMYLEATPSEQIEALCEKIVALRALPIFCRYMPNVHNRDG